MLKRFWLDKKIMLFSIKQILTGSHMLGSQLGKFLILIFFKQSSSVKILLGQEKK